MEISTARKNWRIKETISKHKDIGNNTKVQENSPDGDLYNVIPILFTSTHRKFAKIDHDLGHKQS